MQVQLGPVEHVGFPNASVPSPVAAPVGCREGIVEIAADAQYTEGSSRGNPPTWTALAIQPNTDTIWMETGTNHSSQWAELRTFWLVITHEPWPFPFALKVGLWATALLYLLGTDMVGVTTVGRELESTKAVHKGRTN